MLIIKASLSEEKLVPSLVTEKGYHLGREPANKGQRLPVEILTNQEVKALIRASSNRAPTGIRNRALIVILYRGGLKAGEALHLKPSNVDSQEGTVTVLHGKGDRRRTVGVDPEAMAVIMRWIDRRHELGVNGLAPLFCTLKGRPLKASYLRTVLKRLADRAGINKRVHPHGLRHTMAYELMMEGVPMPIIQHQLGHASLATTERYLRHIAPKDMIKAMRDRSWRLDD